MQRVRGALHAHAQGAVSLSPPVPGPRGGPAAHRRAHRALQRGVDRRTPGVPDARPGAAPCALGGGVREYLDIHPVAARASTRLCARRASVGFPFAASSVQVTGYGTATTSRLCTSSPQHRSKIASMSDLLSRRAERSASSGQFDPRATLDECANFWFDYADQVSFVGGVTVAPPVKGDLGP